MLARENPHCGVSGVPFMNSTTGADDMAWSIAVRVSLDRYRGSIRGMLVVVTRRGREAWRMVCGGGVWG